MTRATRLAFAGEFAAATRMHPLVWVVDPLLAAILAIEVAGLLRDRRWGASARLRVRNPMLVAVAVAMFAVWIARFCGALGGPAPV